MIADIISNKKPNSIVTGVFARGKKIYILVVENLSSQTDFNKLIYYFIIYLLFIYLLLQRVVVQ